MLDRRWSAGILVAAALSLLPTGPFALDPSASHVEFFVKDNRGGFRGVAPDVRTSAMVREVDGTFAAAVEVQIDTRSITTGSGLRDSQMRREFLITDRFPVITLRGTVMPIEPVTKIAFRAIVQGQLTIKDVTRGIEFPVRVIALRDSYLVDGQVTVKMTDFHIPIPRFLIFVAEDPVDVTVRVRLIAQEQP
jgi:polyisoprenoid-binding protein YceI